MFDPDIKKLENNYEHQTHIWKKRCWWHDSDKCIKLLGNHLVEPQRKNLNCWEYSPHNNCSFRGGLGKTDFHTREKRGYLKVFQIWDSWLYNYFCCIHGAIGQSSILEAGSVSFLHITNDAFSSSWLKHLLEVPRSFLHCWCGPAVIPFYGEGAGRIFSH